MLWFLAAPTLIGAIALAIYIVFGWPGRASFVAKRNDLLDDLADLRASVKEKLAPYLDPDSPEQEILERLGGAAPVRRCAMRILPDGKEAFAEMMEAMDRADSSILVQFYIIRDDKLGHELRERLLAAARRGVKVYITFDCFESSITTEYLRPLRDLGAKAIRFKPDEDWSRLLWKGFRNHRKVVVVDGKTAFIGGLNVGDEYVDRDPDQAPWNDTHVRLEGPVVLAAQLSFVQDYYCMAQEVPQLQWEAREADRNDCAVGLICTSPAPLCEPAVLMFLCAISRARRRVWLASPYFVPEEKGIAALQLAAMRGLDVRVIIPGSSDVAPTEFLAWHYIARLLPLGVRFFRQTEGSMHQKVLLVDDALSLIGSCNYDRRSFFLNLEITAWVEGAGTAAEVERMLEEDQARCEEITERHLRERSLLDKAKTQTARLFTGVL